MWGKQLKRREKRCQTFNKCPRFRKPDPDPHSFNARVVPDIWLAGYPAFFDIRFQLPDIWPDIWLAG